MLASLPEHTVHPGGRSSHRTSFHYFKYDANAQTFWKPFLGPACSLQWALLSILNGVSLPRPRMHGSGETHSYSQPSGLSHGHRRGSRVRRLRNGPVFSQGLQVAIRKMPEQWRARRRGSLEQCLGRCSAALRTGPAAASRAFSIPPRLPSPLLSCELPG